MDVFKQPVKFRNLLFILFCWEIGMAIAKGLIRSIVN